MNSTRVSIQPNELCIKAGEAQSAVVVFNASQREMLSCYNSVAVVAAIGFFYGDEIIRQKYRK